MNTKLYYLPLLFLSILLLSGCSEGKAITADPSQSRTTENLTAESASSVSEEQVSAVLHGGTYQVESWSIKDSPEAAGLELSQLSPTVDKNSYQAMKNILMVTIRFTSTPDLDGGISQTTLLNNFLPVTASGIDVVKKALSDPDQNYDDPFGSEAIYLDIGKPGQSNYFEIDTPTEGSSVTYTLAYSLSDDERRAAEDGKLYLILVSEEMDKDKVLPLLHLTEDKHSN